jgi:hypothetical protein
VLADVEHGGRLVGLAELGLVDPALDLVVVLEVHLVVVGALQEGLPVQEEAGGELGRHCIQGAGPQGEDCGVAVDVLADGVAVPHADGLEQSSVLLTVVTEAAAVDTHLATLDDVDALFADRLQESLVGRVECALQLAGHLGLHLLRPPAQEEDGGPYY